MPPRRPTKDAAELRRELDARLRELVRKRDALDLEVAITEAARDRLAGRPNTPDDVRARYAARRKAQDR